MPDLPPRQNSSRQRRSLKAWVVAAACFGLCAALFLYLAWDDLVKSLL